MGKRGPKPGTVRKPVGSGRQKNQPNKVTKDIREIALQMTPKATAKLNELLGSDNHTVAMAAVREVYDRAFGKAPQALTGEGGGPVVMRVSWGAPSDS